MAFDTILLTKWLAILVGLIFTFAGLIKIPNLKGFRLVVKSYGLLPVKIADITATMLPFIEIIIGISLLLRYNLRLTSLAALFFQTIFVIFLIYGYMKNKALENCGCFGAAIPVKLDLKKIATDIGFLLMDILLVLLAFGWI